MDVILDTNVLYADPAFKRNQFAELFAYLRRTKSRMVIPTLVRDELEERYRERLKDAVNTASRAWSHVKQLTIHDYEDPSYVDIDLEVGLLVDRLRKPSEGVDESLFLDLTAIDIKEVAMRGIKRKRPASSKGEELRDVMIWLLVLYHAKQNNGEVAFLSNDGGFRESEDSDGLHPDLEAELVAAKLDVSFHRDIAKFVTTHSLQSRILTNAERSKILNSASLQDEAKKLLLKRITSYGLIEEVEITSLECIKGTEYEVSSDSLYVELIYEGKGSVLARTSYLIGPNVAVNSFTSYAPSVSSVYGSGVYNSGVFGSISPAAYSVNSFEAANSLTTNVFTNNVIVGSSTPAFAAMPSAGKHGLSFTLEVSARIEKSAVVSWQIDRLEIHPEE
jgi:hypothetical protein